MAFKYADHCKVLLVDDSAVLSQMLGGLLTSQGYRVTIAHSREEARNLLRDERFHVAVIDVRLGDSNPYNYEGLQLMYDLRELDPSTGIVLLTLPADLDIAHEAVFAVFGELDPAFEVSGTLASIFLEKEPDTLRTLPDHVRRIAEDVVHINWGLQIIDFQQFIMRIPRRMPFHQGPEVAELQEELDELLRKMFADYEGIDIRTVEEQNQGYSRAFVFQVTADGYPVMIAKVGERSIIEKEVRRFRDFIERWGRWGRNPRSLMSVRRTRNLGGMIYTFDGLDGSIRDFAQFFRNTRDSDHISDVIGNLFLDTLATEHMSRPRVHENVDLRPLYVSLLRLNEEELEAKLDELLVIARSVGRSNTLSQKFWFQTEAPLTNPLDYFQRGSFISSCVETTIHGDLHLHNVLIDKCGETWLIDFANTQRGPLLQDYISFEASILIENNEYPPGRTLFEWSQALFAHPGELFPMLPEKFLEIPELVKVYSAVLKVRQLAFRDRLGGSQSTRSYLIGLFFTTLRLTTVKFLPPPKRFHALVLSALIAENLIAVDNGEAGTILW